MRSNAVRPLLLLFMTLSLCMMSVTRASAGNALRVVLRSASEADRALAPRLRGQLSDLDAQLIVTDIAPLEATFAQQLIAARALAAEHQADLVVWCVDEPAAAGGPPQRRLFIQLAQSDRILSRVLLGVAPHALSSSELETAALLVRGALVALAENVELGVAAHAVAVSGIDDTRAVEHAQAAAAAAAAVARRSEPAPQTRGREDPPSVSSQPTTASANASNNVRSIPSEAEARNAEEEVERTALAAVATEGVDTPAAAPPSGALVVMPAAEQPTPGAPAVRESAIEADRAEAAREGSTRSDATLHARLSLGAQVALDGVSRSGQRGLSARAAVSLGAWAFGAYAVLSLPSNIDDPYFSLSVARHALGLAFERSLFSSETLALGAALHAGALLLRRVSRANHRDALSIPPSLTAALALGPELVFSWMPARFGVSLRFGLDILPSAPRFELAGVMSEHAVVSHSLWTFEPRMMLGWETALL